MGMREGGDRRLTSAKERRAAMSKNDLQLIKVRASRDQWTLVPPGGLEEERASENQGD